MTYENANASQRRIKIDFASQETNDWLNNYKMSKTDSQEFTLRQAFLETFLEGYYLIQFIRDNIIQQFGMVYTLGYNLINENNQETLFQGTVSLEDFYKGVNLDRSKGSLQISLSAQLRNVLNKDRQYKALKKIPSSAVAHKTLFGQVFSLFNENNPLGEWAYNRAGRNGKKKDYTNKGRAFQVYRRIVAMRKRNVAITDFDTLAEIAISVYADSLASITGGDWLNQQLKFFGFQGTGKASLISETELKRVIGEYKLIFSSLQQGNSIKAIKQSLKTLINQPIDQASTRAEKIMINKIDEKIDIFIKEVNTSLN